MIDFDTDLLEMLSEDDHGISFFYRGQTFEGILNREYLAQDIGSAGFESAQTVLYARAVDLDGVEQGDDVEDIGIDNKWFEIVEREPDGTGLIMLRLKRVTRTLPN